MAEQQTHEKLVWEMCDPERDPGRPMAYLRNSAQVCVAVWHDSAEDTICLEVRGRLTAVYPVPVVMGMLDVAYNPSRPPTSEDRITFRSDEGVSVRVPVHILLEVLCRASLFA